MTQATLKQFRAEGGFKTNPSSNFGEIFATKLDIDGVLSIDNNSIAIANANQNLNLIVTGTGVVSTTRLVANQITTSTITGNLIGNVTGNLTGNVVGNVTGNVIGDVTGNVSSSGVSSFSNISVSGGSINSTQIGTSGPASARFTSLEANEITGAIGNGNKNSGSFTTLSATGQLTLTDSTQSSNLSSGALILSGGAAITKNVNIGGNVNITGIASAANPVSGSNLTTKTYVDRQDIKSLAYAVAFGL